MGLCGGQNNASSRPCCQSQASAGVIETNMEPAQQQSYKFRFLIWLDNERTARILPPTHTYTIKCIHIQIHPHKNSFSNTQRILRQTSFFWARCHHPLLELLSQHKHTGPSHRNKTKYFLLSPFLPDISPDFFFYWDLKPFFPELLLLSGTEFYFKKSEKSRVVSSVVNKFLKKERNFTFWKGRIVHINNVNYVRDRLEKKITSKKEGC